MTPRAARSVAAATGVGAAAFGGLVAGGAWWLVAVAGAGAALAGLSDRRAGLVQAVVTIALTAGLVAGGQDWAVAVVVAGVVLSLEGAAAADRVTLVRSTVPAPGFGRLVPAVAAAPAVLAVAALAPAAAVPLSLLATVGGAGLLLATDGS